MLKPPTVAELRGLAQGLLCPCLFRCPTPALSDRGHWERDRSEWVPNDPWPDAAPDVAVSGGPSCAAAVNVAATKCSPKGGADGRMAHRLLYSGGARRPGAGTIARAFPEQMMNRMKFATMMVLGLAGLGAMAAHSGTSPPPRGDSVTDVRQRAPDQGRDRPHRARPKLHPAHPIATIPGPTAGQPTARTG